jgi:hypothetical protein
LFFETGSLNGKVEIEGEEGDGGLDQDEGQGKGVADRVLERQKIISNIHD